MQSEYQQNCCTAPTCFMEVQYFRMQSAYGGVLVGKSTLQERTTMTK